MSFVWLCVLSIHSLLVRGYRYDPAYTLYNTNQNQSAVNPTDYWGQWEGHTYTPSPKNWRFPFYTIFLDRFVNGDPTNDNINGTTFEHDPSSNQMRHGGDLQGLVDTLDYLHGMGIKGLYIAGSPFINQPWTYDQYSPLDLSILEPHFGTLKTWRYAINEIHARGMYVLLDNTFATLGDLMGFEGYLNTTAPFTLKEHRVQWKGERQYWDFDISNEYNETCRYPRFWNETGFPVDQYVTDQMMGCYKSDFDQYGDTEAFGVYPDYRRELTKFASVQDRLREWHEPVRLKIENFYCMLLANLDIDGYRYDKATQSTVDAMASMNKAMRECAARFGKDNFFLPGEITGGNDFGSIFLGRGRQPDQAPDNITQAVTFTNVTMTTGNFAIREPGYGALDAAAFHYTTYRTLTRFLGMDGNLAAGYDAPANWIDQWNTFLGTNDLVNANTGNFDPRHMYGVTNQDVFRWPAITNGVQRQLLGHFVTTMLLPGIPLLLWGEEQAFFTLDNTASNYIFGRQPLSSASAWQIHGCYSLDSTQYYQMPLDAARHACTDDSVSYDHRDPSAPVRNILHHMMQLREAFPVLNDGWFLQQLSNQTWPVVYPGSSGVVTETGMWSVMRSGFPGVQNISTTDVPIWLLYSNLNQSRTYEFDCENNSKDLQTTALLSPYSNNTTKVKNLFYPYDEQTLQRSAISLGTDGSSGPNGCLSSLDMAAYDFRAYVPIHHWISPEPMITNFYPGHDARILSSVGPDGLQEVEVQIQFSSRMNCTSVTESIVLESTTSLFNSTPNIDRGSVRCGTPDESINSTLVGAIQGTWVWAATLTGVAHGVHSLSVNNATTSDGTQSTGSRDRFLFRLGQVDNPVVFPRLSNYSTSLLARLDTGELLLNHSAAGADMFRYSTNFASSFSEWLPYTGGIHQIEKQPWTGTKQQEWKGEHVRVEYFSRLTGSSDYIQEGDLDSKARRFPRMWLNGPYNSYGYDAGLNNEIRLTDHSEWSIGWMTEWTPNGSVAQINVWGINPDGLPDATIVLGDIDGDSILDRLPPSALAPAVLNITEAPPKPFLSWKFVINDGDLRFELQPAGSMWVQLALYVLLWIVPILIAVLSTWLFIASFYKIKLNQTGVVSRRSWLSFAHGDQEPEVAEKPHRYMAMMRHSDRFLQKSDLFGMTRRERQTVLIATMEYDIEDWGIKVKIGGLGVMSQLMGKYLTHKDLIWVIPCIGGVEYPVDEVAEPMIVTIIGQPYEVRVQYHKFRNITYVLLDAPVFRQQTKTDPYPARMDDLESAIYYSAWNQCIAQALTRFPVDLYHINDYHGTIAPLYLLPRSIPACLSLHNAEFQGLWPMRDRQGRQEVCSIFNLDVEIAEEYVQFGEVFNLLHAGASYLRLHQQGFGAVGVSEKYGTRAMARYPIFWGLKKVQGLPNPDPSDTADWDKRLPSKEVSVDPEFERQRLEWRAQAQEWAGLDVNPEAQLFVFVGRWSMQKGVDLIADAFPAILESNPSVQLITVGPVIDLYGKLAALKLDKLMKMYPKRVYSKPEFTALPPYIFSGAEFALIPSRDEPFGLVAVEFGRKGALGVGARVGGLGQMPGWWFTIESMTTSHLLKQFKDAIRDALASGVETRATMRARSAKQRFPVAQWVEDLEILQSTAIRVHGKAGLDKQEAKPARAIDGSRVVSMTLSDGSRRSSISGSDQPEIPPLPAPPGTITRSASQGSAHGPGHSQRYSAGRHDAPISMADAEEIPYDIDIQVVRPVQLHSREKSRDSVLISPIFTPPPLTPGDHSSAKSYFPRPRSHARESDIITALPEIPSSMSLSTLDVSLVVGEKKDFKLQQVDPFFTDSNEHYYREFDKKLGNLTGKNSETSNCIELFLVKSEKEWFSSFRNAKLGHHDSTYSSLRNSMITTHARPSRPVSEAGQTTLVAESEFGEVDDSYFLNQEFMLSADYKPPSGLRKWMQMRIGDWPIYAFLMAFGQIMGANSYQITLLTGEVGQTATKLYAVASIYLATSICWWLLFRRFPAVLSLSLPFFVYGLAFILLGVAPFVSYASRFWVQSVATGVYAVASSSGWLFFSLNFGDEGGAQVKSWCFRACIIQGTQQIYLVALWYWGALFSQRSSHGNGVSAVVGTWKITAIAIPIAAVLWAACLAMWFGLPAYYRQTPGKMPSFYSSLAKRKVVLWFLLTAVVQNFFLSAPYGRNWTFLFSSQFARTWQVLVLVAIFFIVIWAGFLWIFGQLSRSHSWILPLFAIGLGAPRWAQIWWGTSNIGLYLPWASSPVVGALLSRALWLWLGVLDSLQGVGLGMIMLGTLTRVHVAFAITASQVLGSMSTIVARAVAPNRLGPGPISPDITSGIGSLWQPWFWVGLILNLSLCVGFYKFYRKEQLQKP